MFSDRGRQSLIESLCEKAANKESSTFVSLYTCSPYTFVLGIHEQNGEIVTKNLHSTLNGRTTSKQKHIQAR